MNTKQTEATGEAASEPRNVAVTALEKGVVIGNAEVACGPVDFPLTKTEAESLEALGKVKITGIFTPQH